ncbi:MAG: molybdate ABC transporter substrate-binding protein [Lachnospiraceae bacterium]|nr:molybdate ABC transporter substrate-binding protein [Lachnospiraceae bacterium]
MRKLNKVVSCVSVLALSMGLLVGCGGNVSSSETAATTAGAAETTATTATTAASEKTTETAKEPYELTILAAASLTDVCTELETMYETAHPECELTFSYGGSGALMAQIQEGAPCDVFISAAKKQMKTLDEASLMNSDSIVELLENKVVLIVPKDSKLTDLTFENLTLDEVKMVGLGEPSSVPVGQYAEEIFTSLGILDQVKAKANYGSDVRVVLSWVEEGAVDAGVVYATDAATSDKIVVVAEAPEGSISKVIYPAGIVKASSHPEEASDFVAFLQSEEAMKVFEQYGFVSAQ